MKPKPESNRSVVKTEKLLASNEEQTKNCDTENTDFDTKQLDLSTLDESIIKELMSLETPNSEVVVDENSITELEKVIHYEFFEGRPAKTPLRYMKVYCF